METSCRMCARPALSPALDLGTAAIANHFPASAAETPDWIPFRLAACRCCGLIQLCDVPPVELVRQRGESIAYREPEGHLDDLTRALVPRLTARDGLALGVMWHDKPLLERLQARGRLQAVSLDRQTAWSFLQPREGLETVQQQLSPAWAESVRQTHGPARFLSLRRLLEHAHHPRSMLEACRRLVEPGCQVLIEVPGCITEFTRGDVGALWEEHVQYFTTSSLRRGLESIGFRCEWETSYRLETEDVLVVLGQFCEPPPSDSASTINGGVELIDQFAAARQRVREQLVRWAAWADRQVRRVALFGAGHRTTTFAHLLPAADLVTGVIDDDVRKHGRFLPGTRLPILSAEAFATHNIGVCVGLLSRETLDRIAAKHAAFLPDGCRFLTQFDLLTQSPPD